MVINLGTRINRYVCLAKETVFSHLLATTIIMIKMHGQQLNSSSNIYFFNMIDVNTILIVVIKKCS